MRYFLAPLLIGLFLVIALNVYVDPMAKWWRSYSFTKNWNDDQCWVTPLRMDERRPRTQHIKLLSKIDTLALGSSRLFTVTSDMFPAGTKLYNASMSGATVWDYVGIWQQFKEQNNIPKQVIIYADTWVFNKNIWQKYRWIAVAPSVFAFLQDSSANDQDRASLLRYAAQEYVVGEFFQLTDLLNPGIIKESLLQLKTRLQGGDIKSDYVIDIQAHPEHLAAWKNDGSEIVPIEDRTPKPLAEITEIGRNTGLGSMYMYMRDWDVDDNIVALFRLLLTDMTAHGVNVLVVQPPFQHEAYKALSHNLEYKEIMPSFDAAMEDVSEQNTGISYCNAVNPHVIGCNETEFVDSSHPMASCEQKILDYCMKRMQQHRLIQSLNGSGGLP